jgi:hypothetical protein
MIQAPFMAIAETMPRRIRSMMSGLRPTLMGWAPHAEHHPPALTMARGDGLRDGAEVAGCEDVRSVARKRPSDWLGRGKPPERRRRNLAVAADERVGANAVEIDGRRRVPRRAASRPPPPLRGRPRRRGGSTGDAGDAWRHPPLALISGCAGARPNRAPPARTARVR